MDYVFDADDNCPSLDVSYFNYETMYGKSENNDTLFDSNVYYIQDTKQEENKTVLGRKKKNSGEKGKHTKEKEDNRFRKIKVKFRNDLKNFINQHIKNLNLNISDIDFNHEQYKGTEIELKNIGQTKIKDGSVDCNLDLLHSTVREFFSGGISKSYKNYPPNYNALLIAKIYEKDYDKKVTPILDKTFLDCLKYYRKEEFTIKNDNFKCLQGLQEGFEKIEDYFMKKNDNDQKYVESLIKLIKDYDTIFFNKQRRESKKKV